MTVQKKSTQGINQSNTLSFFDAVAYGLNKSRYITMHGTIDLDMFNNTVMRMEYMKSQSKQQVNISLNSGGGSVIDGLAIYDKIIGLRNDGIPVTITANGYCMSMAIPILQSATTRQATKHTDFLLHEVSYGMGGTQSQHENSIKHTERLTNSIHEILIERSKLTKKKLIELTKLKDHYLSAQEALEYGLIDKII